MVVRKSTASVSPKMSHRLRPCAGRLFVRARVSAALGRPDVAVEKKRGFGIRHEKRDASCPERQNTDPKFRTQKNPVITAISVVEQFAYACYDLQNY